MSKGSKPVQQTPLKKCELCDTYIDDDSKRCAEHKNHCCKDMGFINQIDPMLRNMPGICKCACHYQPNQF